MWYVYVKQLGEWRFCHNADTLRDAERIAKIFWAFDGETWINYIA